MVSSLVIVASYMSMRVYASIRLLPTLGIWIGLLKWHPKQLQKSDDVRQRGGPLPEHWDDVMKEKKPAKIRMTKNKQTLGLEKSATLLHDWVDFSSIKANLCSLGTESQTLEAKSAADSQGQMGSTMMFSVGFLCLNGRGCPGRYFSSLSSSPTQNPMRKRKATLGIESGSFPTGLLYRRVMTALGFWKKWLEQISTKLPCRWSQWWRRRARPEEQVK